MIPTPSDISRIVSDDSWADDWEDITATHPDISIAQAYDLQMKVMKSRVEAGDRIVGYKAAATSVGAGAELQGFPVPTVGTLLASQLAPDGVAYTRRPGRTYVEAEIAIVTGRKLVGPVSLLEVASACESFHPAIEIAPWSPAAVDGRRSVQHVIATQKTDGLVVVGHGRPARLDDDLRLEGAVLRVDGTGIGSSTGFEAMGNPLEVVRAIVEHLAPYGLGIEPGMVVMTGSLLRPCVLTDGARAARVDFTSLGSVEVSFHDANG